jgi:two-component system response regulator HydG
MKKTQTAAEETTDRSAEPLGDFGDAVQETVTAAIYTVNRDGVITAWNKGAEQLLGYTADEVLGAPCKIIGSTTCAGADCIDGAFACPLFADGGVWSRRCAVKHQSGRLIPVLKTGQILESDGEVVGGVETLTDISALVGEKTTAVICETTPSAPQGKEPEPGSRRMVGSADCMQAVRALAQRASESDVTVLLLGESGTGKELLAEAIHTGGPLASNPFVRVDCASLSDTLLESELFGHVKGAFTGANAARRGRFEAADGGSVFLDEIGDMSLHVQKKLLRFLQSREFERVGDNQTRRVDVRIISATHRDLREMVERGTFREDLFWRLSAFPIELPPLRQRIDDVVALAEHFLQLHWRQDTPTPSLSGEVRQLLLGHGWPGNCRELENVMWYAATLARDDQVSPEHLPPQFGMTVAKPQSEDSQSLLAALERCKWNRSKAAALLGISRVTLWRRMQKLGISPE